MKTLEQFPINNINTSINSKFQKLKKGYVIDCPCIIVKDNLLIETAQYDLCDFGNKPEDTTIRKVLFLSTYNKGYKIIFVLLDLARNKLLTRSYRLNSEYLPCNWVITDVINPPFEADKREIDDFGEEKRILPL